MCNLIEMDLRRMFKTPLLFALILVLGVMVGTFGFTGVMGTNESIAGLIGPVDMAGDMMSTMGMSLTQIFGAVYVVTIIGKDFSTGFIKNILTVHAGKKAYILSKIVIGTIASFTIAGTNNMSVINSTMGGLLHILITVIVWLFGAAVLGCIIMKKKDV